MNDDTVIARRQNVDGSGHGPSRSGNLLSWLSDAMSEWRRRSTWVDYVMLGLRIALLIIVVAGLTRSLTSNEYSARDWASFAVFGLTLGSIYALVSLGYTMVYGVLRMINFAHGDVFTTGAFGGLIVAGPFIESGSTVGLIGVLVAGASTSAAIAVLIERVAYRAFSRSGSLAPLICAIGASFVLQYTIRGLFGTGSRAYPDVAALNGAISLGIVQIPLVQLFVIAAALLAMAVLHVIVQHTTLGTSMRAVAEDREAAALMGINSDRVVTLTFMIGGTMAGVAGVLYALVFKQIHAFMGFTLGIKGFAAAVLGGIGNIPGAMAGGFLLGLSESFGPAALLSGFGIPAPYQLKDAIAYGLLVMILIFRPRGIFGERLSVKRM
ncbi:branched-chain amino acid ABC transporter permease [Mesorhizobium sp. M2A.F.Ca.ET.039.01.1.1]|uniref:branched-chain amino acid ABC transporter permease n=1 Tax=Mesorhizobium sp. M2A.F.Ca.ET.039.01.1.1 TaxID=2496746 RepID=UPI001FDEDA05|nr:branched-chain amino acid ABC transporter permease [Mesorhizobium sp. M2A.F.Ca.ET.039.01.1.1]